MHVTTNGVSAARQVSEGCGSRVTQKFLSEIYIYMYTRANVNEGKVELFNEVLAVKPSGKLLVYLRQKIKNERQISDLLLDQFRCARRVLTRKMSEPRERRSGRAGRCTTRQGGTRDDRSFSSLRRSGTRRDHRHSWPAWRIKRC
ncbi:hypothetical protein PUN28_013798 [Cardiocondyla obscurior]|uniref:Uncharacterized protein n=1 Tax=Cardiocondyla obscurior TaxID=286306 RepID=A0AAW2F897_9HYME